MISMAKWGLDFRPLIFKITQLPTQAWSLNIMVYWCEFWWEQPPVNYHMCQQYWPQASQRKHRHSAGCDFPVQEGSMLLELGFHYKKDLKTWKTLPHPQPRILGNSWETKKLIFIIASVSVLQNVYINPFWGNSWFSVVCWRLKNPTVNGWDENQTAQNAVKNALWQLPWWSRG